MAWRGEARQGKLTEPTSGRPVRHVRVHTPFRIGTGARHAVLMETSSPTESPAAGVLAVECPRCGRLMDLVVDVASYAVEDETLTVTYAPTVTWHPCAASGSRACV